MLGNPNEIQLPKLAEKKTPKLKTVRGELTTLNNADVVVKPSGKVIVKHLKTTTEVAEGAEDVSTEESKAGKAFLFNNYFSNKCLSFKLQVILNVKDLANAR